MDAPTLPQVYTKFKTLFPCKTRPKPNIFVQWNDRHRMVRTKLFTRIMQKLCIHPITASHAPTLISPSLQHKRGKNPQSHLHCKPVTVKTTVMHLKASWLDTKTHVITTSWQWHCKDTRKTERKEQFSYGDTYYDLHVLTKGTMTQLHTLRDACAGRRCDFTKCTGQIQSVDFTTQDYNSWDHNMPHGVLDGVQDRWKVSKIWFHNCYC